MGLLIEITTHNRTNQFLLCSLSKLATGLIGIVPELGRFLSGETQHYFDYGRRSRLWRYFRLWYKVLSDTTYRPIGGGRAAVHKWILFGFDLHTYPLFLLTGTYAFRRPNTGIAPPNSPALIQPGTETVASVLQSVGYKTAVVGKWHLGLGGPEGPDWNGDLKPGPREIGFDYSFLLPTTNDRVPQVYVKNHQVVDLDPNDPLWVGKDKPSEDHPTGITHRDT